VNRGPEYEDRLRAAKRNLYGHPAYIEFRDLEALYTTLTAIFAPNFSALMGLIDAAAANEELALELVQNVRRPDVRNRFLCELARALHNHVAGAGTLVDHVRRLMRNRTGPTASDFERLKQAIVQDRGEVQFVQGLRNFMLHRTLPLVGHTVTFDSPDASGSQRIRGELHLSVPQLLEDTKWAAPVREFLLAQGEDVELRPVVRAHGEAVYQLNTWLHDRLMSEVPIDAMKERSAAPA